MLRTMERGTLQFARTLDDEPSASTVSLVSSNIGTGTHTHTHTHTRTHPFNGPLSRTTRVSRYQKGKTNLDFTGARDSEWQWHQMGHMQVCTSLQTDSHASTPPLSFLQTGCPSCRPTNSVKALKASNIGTGVQRNCRRTARLCCRLGLSVCPSVR